MASRKKQRKEPARVSPAAPKAVRGRWVLIALASVAVMVGAGLVVILTAREGDGKRVTPVKQAIVDEPLTEASSAQDVVEKLAATPMPAIAPRGVNPDYAGSGTCRDCHPGAYEKWRTSHHALAERPMDPKLDGPAFEPSRSFNHGSQSTQVRRSGEAFEVTALGLSQKAETHVAQRAIGVSPLVQYLAPFPGGRWQTLEATYDPHKNEWFNVYGNEDRKPGEWGHWTGRGMNWNNMCSQCHNTGLNKNYDPASDSYKTNWAELGVGCEACHGPMKPHVEWQKKLNRPVTPYDKTNPPAQRDPTVVKVGRLQMFDVCGSCHARQGMLTGTFMPGQKYSDHYSLVIPDQTDLFHPDGQIRDEDYEFTSFRSSRMHAGGVRCMDCHEPHAAKPVLQGNTLCMKCHSGSYPNAPVIDPGAHSFHKPDSTGSLCKNCHMPQTVYMQRHWRHDHGFTIPDPLLTKQHQIPNACNRCHADKDTDWALQAVEQWYGKRMERPTRARAQVIAQARKGDPEAREGLLRILKEERITLWRGAAASLLRGYTEWPEVRKALIEATGHADPLVRENAAAALGQLATNPETPAGEAVRKLLDDKVRAVRVRAAMSFLSSIDPKSPIGDDLLTFLNYNQDQPSGSLQLAGYHYARRDMKSTLALTARSVQWDPFSVPFRDMLATGLAQSGRAREAVGQLQEAVRLEPGNPDWAYRLALAYNEIGEHKKVIESLQKAVELNPRFARAWYNLGLALNRARRVPEAIAALRKSCESDPRDAEAPYALATVYRSQGNIPAARAAAQQALRANPEYGPALELLRVLPPEQE